MQLIGMLDSPYVRRTAVSLRLLELPFEHRAVSVFTTFAEFQKINPVVKAPSLICDDGEVLMDSTLILLYAERLAASGRTLMPSEPNALQRSLRIIGLALGACEKCIQNVYEHSLRPAEKWHQPWLERVQGQALAAFASLERELTNRPLAVSSSTIDQAGVTTAVAWQFAQSMVPNLIVAERYPQLARHSELAESLAEFRAYPPLGPGVPSDP
jgi:glutathione S-transferase